MTQTSTGTTRTAESAAAVVTEFFDRYRAHDVDGMTDLCSINAGFSYVPVEMWGKQRVLRGDGTVGTVGKPLWAGLIAWKARSAPASPRSTASRTSASTGSGCRPGGRPTSPTAAASSSALSGSASRVRGNHWTVR